MEHSSTAKIKVAIVDDHEVVRQGLKLLISSSDSLELVADAGKVEEAESMLDQTAPDVLVSDISLPTGTAFEMVKRVTDKHPGLKVVFLTAFCTDTNLGRALKAGVDGFLSKNEPLENVLEAIEVVYKGEKYYSKEIEGRLSSDFNDGRKNSGSNERSVRGETLSAREIEVLCFVASGLTAKQIASSLKISSKTVERHKSNIMAKLGIHSQVELARYAFREGLIAP